MLPGRAAVGGAEDAVLPFVRPEVPLRRHVDDVPVGRMGDDLGDVVRLNQAHVRERRAAVGGLVDAVAPS